MLLYFPNQLSPICQLRLHFFEKLQYYTLGNKNYSKKLFWGAVDVVVNAANVWSTVTALVVSRNKALAGFINKAAKTFQIWQSLKP